HFREHRVASLPFLRSRPHLPSVPHTTASFSERRLVVRVSALREAKPLNREGAERRAAMCLRGQAVASVYALPKQARHNSIALDIAGECGHASSELRLRRLGWNCCMLISDFWRRPLP